MKISIVKECRKDSGYAWVIMACSLLINCCSWGLNASFSVFLNYFLTHSTFAGAKSIDFTFICGIAYGLGLAGSPLALYICNYIPHRMVIAIGSLFLAAAFVGGSFCTSISQLYVTLGLLQGAGIFLVYIPSNALVPQWFDKKLGLANGIAMAGTGLGGVIFTLAANHIVETQGVNAAMRILGITASAGCLAAGLLCKAGNTVDVKPKLWDSRIFKRVDLLCVILWTALGNFANSIALFSMGSFGTSIGLTSAQTTIIGVCTNAGAIFGRPVMGFLLDSFGVFNVSLVYTGMSTLLVFAYWIPCNSFIALAILCVLLGNFLSFAGVSPSPITASIMGDIEFSSIYSVTWLVVGILSTFSVPTVTALRFDSLSRPFIWSQIFTGLFFVVAVMALLYARQYRVRLALEQTALKDHTPQTPGTPDTLYGDTAGSTDALPTASSLTLLDGDTPYDEESAMDYFSIVKVEKAPEFDAEKQQPDDMPGFWARMFYSMKV